MTDSNERTKNLIAMLPIAVAMMIVAVPALQQDQAAGMKQIEERVRASERNIEDLQNNVRDVDLRMENVEAANKAAVASMGELLPPQHGWLELRKGGSQRFKLETAGEVKLQFLRNTDEGTPMLTLTVRGNEVEMPAQPGTAVQLIDDRGSERRLLNLTVHQVRNYRNGTPMSALVSASERVE
jgi:hypothetical protein